MSAQTDKNAKRFSKLVSAADPAPPPLPLVHTTDGFSFRNALISGQLTAQQCEKFHQPLLYLFYGRPAYRPHMEELPTGLRHYLPICYILKPDTKMNIARIFPFDSGAFIQNVYQDALHGSMTIDDFSMSPLPDTPAKVVSLFYGDNEAYIEARSRNNLSFSEADFEAKSYQALITDKMRNSFDDRVSGIEIQTTSSITLKDNVLAVVVPTSFAEDNEFSAMWKTIGIDAIPYRFTDRARPSEYVSTIFGIVFDYYKANGFL